MKKILIVDDIWANRFIITEFLKTLGLINVIQAINGREALEQLKKYDVSIIFMDIEMPIMNGVESVIYIRNVMKNDMNKLPVIAITAHDPSLYFEKYSDCGFNELVSKPYTIDKIKEVLIKYNILG